MNKRLRVAIVGGSGYTGGEVARLLIGYRLPPGYDSEGLRTQLECWAYEDGAQISFSGEEKAYQTTRTTPLARAFIKAIRATGERLGAIHCAPTATLGNDMMSFILVAFCLDSFQQIAFY